MADTLLFFVMKYNKNVLCNSKKESIDEQMLKEYKKQFKQKYMILVNNCYYDYF